MKPFDLQKALAGEPVVTRNGDKVLQLKFLKEAVEEGMAFPIAAVIKGTNNIILYTEDGAYYAERDSGLDLCMESQKVKRWVNFYLSGSCHAHPTRHIADLIAGTDRVACLEIEYEEGEGL